MAAAVNAGSLAFLDGMTSGSLAFLRGRIGAPRPTDPLLLFTHGSGFNAGGWRPTLERLRRLGIVSAEVLAFDWTGHGKSRPPRGSGVSAERYDWREVAPRDIFELLGEQAPANARPLYGIGHSFGGAGLALAELARPGTFSGIVLIEPIIRSPGPSTHPLVERTLRRRARFDVASHTDVVAHFASRAYASWDKDALAGYVERGFRPVTTAAGERYYELTCAPETEACVYLGGMQVANAGGLYNRLGEVGCACTVCAGETSETLSSDERTNVDQHRLIAGALKGCTLPVAVAQGRGHFVPSM